MDETQKLNKITSMFVLPNFFQVGRQMSTGCL